VVGRFTLSLDGWMIHVASLCITLMYVGCLSPHFERKYGTTLIELTRRWKQKESCISVPRNTSTYCSSILGLPTCRSDARVTDKLCRIARGPVAFPRTAPASACRWMHVRAPVGRGRAHVRDARMPAHACTALRSSSPTI
jgi:hypothetical protein